MQSYQYLPLLDRNLRFVTLLPGRFHDPIKIFISHNAFSTVEKSSYEALSYVWGSRADPASIHVQNIPANSSLMERLRSVTTWDSLSITRNLEAAFRHLRHLVRERILWVDAICINQNDDEEKAAQLPRMGVIYKSASSVAIWLGVEADGSALAVRRLAKIAKDVQVELTPPFKLTYKQTILPNKSKQLEENKPSQVDLMDEWSAINRLLRRTWFMRLWVYQEMHLATAADVFVGHDKISWSDFIRGFRWISNQVRKFPESPLGSNFDRKFIRSIFELLDPLEGGRWYGLLIKTKGLECSDPRDRFYGLLGLIPPHDIPAIIPDLSMSIQEVYRAWTMVALSSSQSLSILELCNFRESTSPSWSLDPSYVELPTPIAYHRPIQAGSFSYRRHKTVKLENGDWSLEVKGKFIDIVDEVYPACPLNATRDEVVAFCHTWNKDFNRVGQYVAGGSYFEALACTLICNMFEARAVKVPRGMSAPEFCTAALEGIWNGVNRASYDRYKSYLHDFIPGRSLCHTNSGYLGLCPPTVKPGDMVFVAESKETPILVREVPNQPGMYRLVGGECYIHGMMNLEAFLGPLPNDWRMEYKKFGDRNIALYIPPDIRQPQQEDPRLLGVLPRGWKKVYQDSSRKLNPEEYDNDGKLRKRMFHDISANTIQEADPRLSADALTSDHGLELEEILLV